VENPDRLVCRCFSVRLTEKLFDRVGKFLDSFFGPSAKSESSARYFVVAVAATRDSVSERQPKIASNAANVSCAQSNPFSDILFGEAATTARAVDIQVLGNVEPVAP
jgi:hypothetical protein